MKKLVMKADHQIWVLSDFNLGLKLPNTNLEQQPHDYRSSVNAWAVRPHLPILLTI
jgi:hypothetical protein